VFADVPAGQEGGTDKQDAQIASLDGGLNLVVPALAHEDIGVPPIAVVIAA
jgi:hypothetical protein